MAGKLLADPLNPVKLGFVLDKDRSISGLSIVLANGPTLRYGPYS